MWYLYNDAKSMEYIHGTCFIFITYAKFMEYIHGQTCHPQTKEAQQDGSRDSDEYGHF
jgi:hypothetical protein